MLQLKPWYSQGFVVYYSMIRNDNKGDNDMSLTAEIVVEQGNTNLDADGWKVCSFWDTDSDGMEFVNYEVAYWRGGSIDWGSLNGCLNYFTCIDRALDFYEGATGTIVGAA